MEFPHGLETRERKALRREKGGAKRSHDPFESGSVHWQCVSWLLVIISVIFSICP